MELPDQQGETRIETSQLQTNPTDPFTISEPRDLPIHIFYVVRKHRSTGFEARNSERVGRVPRLCVLVVSDSQFKTTTVE